MGLEEMSWEVIDWNQQAQDGGTCLAFMNVVINVGVSLKAVNLLTG
jgi:hypothetical protein